MRQNRVSSFLGGSENIPRPLAGGSDAGGGDATTRAPVRAKESNPTYSHEHDPGKIPAGGRSRRRRGAFVASSPVAEELGQLERKPKTAATPRTRFPRKRSPARRTRGRARIRRTGLQRRVRSPSPRFFPSRGPENAQRRGSANGRSREARAHLCDVKARRRSRGYSRVVTRASRSRKTGAPPSTACVEAPLGSV